MNQVELDALAARWKMKASEVRAGILLDSPRLLGRGPAYITVNGVGWFVLGFLGGMAWVLGILFVGRGSL
jgi:hypothetical protein